MKQWSQLKKFKISLPDNCASLGPNSLRNPYYDDLYQDDKECAAYSLIVQCDIHTIFRSKCPAQRVIAPFFVNKDILTTDELKEFFSAKNGWVQPFLYHIASFLETNFPMIFSHVSSLSLLPQGGGWLLLHLIWFGLGNCGVLKHHTLI